MSDLRGFNLGETQLNPENHSGFKKKKLVLEATEMSYFFI